jgi:hypothetical protein
MLATASSGPPVEEGLFFLAWEAEGAVPAQVPGVVALNLGATSFEIEFLDLMSPQR